MKKPKIKPAEARNVWQRFRSNLAETKASLARIDDMLSRGQVRLIFVPATRVRAHVRNEHWRPYYPPTRSKKS